MTPERRAKDRDSNRISLRVYETSKGWAVVWQSDRMKAPCFWYEPTEQQARKTAAKLQGGAK